MAYYRGPRIGQYRAQCSPGFCLAESEPGTSKVERDLFTLLRQVLGRGEQGYIIDSDHRLRSDMAFHIESGFTIVVEYDGAHWHTEREEHDSRKSEIIKGYDRHDVVRIREAPLRPLHATDLVVPKRADGLRCARLTLPHLAHTFYDHLVDSGVVARIGHLVLANGRRGVRLWRVCTLCPLRARNLRRALHPASPPAPEAHETVPVMPGVVEGRR